MRALSTAIAWAIPTLAVVASGVLSRGAAGEDDQTAGIRKQSKAFVAAWNRHDPKAMAALWTDDGDTINPWGRKASGRAEVEAMLLEEQTGTGPLRESTMDVKSETVRFPTTDTAVTDSEVVVSGAFGHDGAKAPPIGLHVTSVWRKSEGAWRVFASRPYVEPVERTDDLGSRPIAR